jgi:hypothetical protein
MYPTYPRPSKWISNLVTGKTLQEILETLSATRVAAHREGVSAESRLDLQQGYANIVSASSTSPTVIGFRIISTELMSVL